MSTLVSHGAARVLTATVLALVTQDLAMPQSNSFVVEATIEAVPYDLEVTPNGKVAAVRSNLPTNNNPSDWKLSVWRTDTPTNPQILPNLQNVVGRGNGFLHPTTGQPMF